MNRSHDKRSHRETLVTPWERRRPAVHGTGRTVSIEGAEELMVPWEGRCPAVDVAGQPVAIERAEPPASPVGCRTEVELEVPTGPRAEDEGMF